MLAIKSDVSVNSILILCMGIDFVFSEVNVIAFFITALNERMDFTSTWNYSQTVPELPLFCFFYCDSNPSQ